MRANLRLAAWAALILSFATVAEGKGVREEIVWRCELLPDGEPALGCRLVGAEKADAAAEPRSPVERLIRGRLMIVIPLYSPSEDLSRVARLAQAVMCWRTPDCRAEIVEPPASPAPAAPDEL